MKTMFSEDFIQQLVINSFLVVFALLVLAAVLYVILDFLKKPFQKPAIVYRIDLGTTENPDYEDFIDRWVINQVKKNGKTDISYDFYRQMFNRGVCEDILRRERKTAIAKWKASCVRIISKSLFWKARKMKAFKALAKEVTSFDYPLFWFLFYRNRKSNGLIYCVTEKTIEKSFNQLCGIDRELCETGYKATRKKSAVKDQRMFMNKELHKKIMKRDKFTCQICGKNMADGAKLQVGFLNPAAEEGKFAESNLRTICNQCVGEKEKK